MTRSEEKKLLRSEIRAAEKQLSPAYRCASSASINACLLSLPEYRAAETVFAFVGTAHEIDTAQLLQDALRSGKRLCVPLCTGPGIMELRCLSSLEDLTPGAYGIPEPKASCPAVDDDEVDFAVIPCLSCDRKGRRLGKGGGFYDRFLSAYRSTAVLVCQERLMREEIPTESHDCVIPLVVTEKGLYEDGTPARPD